MSSHAEMRFCLVTIIQSVDAFNHTFQLLRQVYFTRAAAIGTAAGLVFINFQIDAKRLLERRDSAGKFDGPGGRILVYYGQAVLMGELRHFGYVFRLGTIARQLIGS